MEKITVKLCDIIKEQQLNELGYEGNIGIADLHFVSNFGSKEHIQRKDELLTKQKKKEISGKEFWTAFNGLVKDVCAFVKSGKSTKPLTDRAIEKIDKNFCQRELDIATI